MNRKNRSSYSWGIKRSSEPRPPGQLAYATGLAVLAAAGGDGWRGNEFDGRPSLTEAAMDAMESDGRHHAWGEGWEGAEPVGVMAQGPDSPTPGKGRGRGVRGGTRGSTRGDERGVSSRDVSGQMKDGLLTDGPISESGAALQGHSRLMTSASVRQVQPHQESHAVVHRNKILRSIAMQAGDDSTAGQIHAPLRSQCPTDTQKLSTSTSPVPSKAPLASPRAWRSEPTAYPQSPAASPRSAGGVPHHHPAASGGMRGVSSHDVTGQMRDLTPRRTPRSGGATGGGGWPTPHSVRHMSLGADGRPQAETRWSTLMLPTAASFRAMSRRGHPMSPVSV